MLKQKVLDSFIIRLVEEDSQRCVHVHHLKTGERLEFETWEAAWCYLEVLFDKVRPTHKELS